MYLVIRQGQSVNHCPPHVTNPEWALIHCQSPSCTGAESPGDMLLGEERNEVELCVYV